MPCKGSGSGVILNHLLILPAAAAALLTGCSFASGPLGSQEVCGVARTYFNTPPLNNEHAWDWPAEAKEQIGAHRWTEASTDVVKPCGSATVPIVGLSMSEDRKLALLTRSTYPFFQSLDAGPVEAGSIDTCLLQREPDGWKLVACKLDAVS